MDPKADLRSVLKQINYQKCNLANHGIDYLCLICLDRGCSKYLELLCPQCHFQNVHNHKNNIISLSIFLLKSIEITENNKFIKVDDKLIKELEEAATKFKQFSKQLVEISDQITQSISSLKSSQLNPEAQKITEIIQ